MSVFFNWPVDGTPSATTGRQASFAIASALEALMRLLRSYEREEGDTDADINEAATQLWNASKIFHDLQSIADNRPVQISSHIAAAWYATDTFGRAVGNVLRDAPELKPPPLWDNGSQFSFRDLLRFAELITRNLSDALQGLDPNLRLAAEGRNIATDAAVLQMFGILVAEISANNSKS